MAGGDFEKNVHQLTGSHWKKNVPLCGHYDVVFFLQNIHNYQFQKLLVSWSYQFQNRTLSRFQKTKHTQSIQAFGTTFIVCIEVSIPTLPLKSTTPSFLASPPPHPVKSTNCPSPSFLGNLPLYVGFL